MQAPRCRNEYGVASAALLLRAELSVDRAQEQRPYASNNGPLHRPLSGGKREPCRAFGSGTNGRAVGPQAHAQVATAADPGR